MEYEKMWDELIIHAKADPQYQKCLARVRALEKEYLAVCATLSTEQATLVEEYIAACEEISDCMTVLAYQLWLSGE